MAKQPGGQWGPTSPGTPAMYRQHVAATLDSSSSTTGSSNSNISTLQQAYSGLPAASSPRPPGSASNGHPRSNVAIQRFAAALDAAGLADPVVRALALKHSANSGGDTSTAEEDAAGLSNSSSGSGTFRHSARQHNSYLASNPESLQQVAKEVQDFASAVSAAGLANPTFMAIAATANDAAAAASATTSAAASPRAPTTTPMLHTASSNTSSTMRTLGSSQLTGISAAGIIAPLRSSDYGTMHRDYAADHSNSSSLTGEAIEHASWGKHRWRSGSYAAAAPGVPATAGDSWGEGPVGQPAAAETAAADERDWASSEPQLWLSPVRERQQQQQQQQQGDYSRSSARSSMSASTAADGTQPVLQEGLSKRPSSVCPADYAYLQSRQGSESCVAGAETLYGGRLQQVTEAGDAANWWMNVKETSEEDEQQMRHESRRSVAGAAVAAAGAAASAALGGIKSMLALAGRRSNLGRHAASAQLPVEDASSREHADSMDKPAATAWADASQHTQQQQADSSIATPTGSSLRHRVSWGAAATAASAGRGSSSGKTAPQHMSSGSAASCGKSVDATAGVASISSSDADASSSSSSIRGSAASDVSDRRAATPHTTGGLATLLCCRLRPATAAVRSADSRNSGGKHSTASHGSSMQGAGKRKCTSLTLLLTVLVLLAVSGIGVGMYFGIDKQPKQQRARAAKAAAAQAAAAAALAAGGTAGAAAVAIPVTPMNFQVVLAVPAVSAEQGCRTWFGSNERLETYKAIFAASYSAALEQQVPESSINSITCDGNDVYKVVYTSGRSNVTIALPPPPAAAAAAAAAATTGPATSTGSAAAAAPPPSRHLLENPGAPHTHRGRSLTSLFERQSPLAVVEVVTRFSMPAPPTHADRARIAETVVTGSSAILSGPMSDFFKVPSALMNFVPWSSKTNDRESGALTHITAPTAVPRMSYAEAPTCLFPLTQHNSMSDDSGRLWSMMDGNECVFRPAAAPVPKPVITWEDAPTCDDEATENNSVVDLSGRLWGWQDVASCAFKHNESALPSSGTASAARMGAGSRHDVPGRVSVAWEAAPSCLFPPTRANTMTDTLGRLWGWENGKSCVFRWQSLSN